LKLGTTSNESQVHFNQPRAEEIMRVHRTLDNLGGGYFVKRPMNIDSLGGGYLLKRASSPTGTFDSLGGGYLL
jgi:hypothetical protein